MGMAVAITYGAVRATRDRWVQNWNSTQMKVAFSSDSQRFQSIRYEPYTVHHTPRVSDDSR